MSCRTEIKKEKGVEIEGRKKRCKQECGEESIVSSVGLPYRGRKTSEKMSMMRFIVAEVANCDFTHLQLCYKKRGTIYLNQSKNKL